MTGERAQASVETVVLLPVLVLLGLAAWQVLLAGWALQAAQDSAAAGARAASVGEPVRAVVAASLPPRMRGTLRLSSSGGRLVVSVVVPSVIPGFAPRIEASADGGG